MDAFSYYPAAIFRGGLYVRCAGFAHQFRLQAIPSGVFAPSWLLVSAALLGVAGCQAPWNLASPELDFAAASPYPTAQQSASGGNASQPVEPASKDAREIGSQLTPAQAPAAAGSAPAQSVADLRNPQPKPLPLTPANMRGRIDDAAPAQAAKPNDVAKLPQPAAEEALSPKQADALRSTAQQASQQQTLEQMAALLQKFQSQSTTSGQQHPIVPALSPQLAALAATAGVSTAPVHPSPAAAPPATAQPDGSLQAWRDLCQQASSALEEEVRQRKKSGAAATDLVEMQQKLRLLYLAADRPDQAAAGIEELTPAERKAFQDLAFALSTWLSPQESKHLNLKGAKVLRSLRDASDGLAAVSKLDLKNLAFCEKVEGFGWYTQFSRYDFTPKQEVLLYLELENFSAEEKTARQFETELQGSYQIFDSAGAIVDQRQLPLDRETCRNLRRDYFIAYRIFLPEQLPPGRYRLELTVEDLKAKAAYHGRKLGEGMIEFTIRS